MTSNDIKKGQKVITKSGKPAIISSDRDMKRDATLAYIRDENGNYVEDVDCTKATIRSLKDGKPFGPIRTADISTLTLVND